MERDRLAGLLQDVLAAGRPMTKRYLVRELSTGGTLVSASEINSVLYQRSDQFSHDELPLPRWSLRRSAPGTARRTTTGRPPSRAAVTAGSRYGGHPLRAWQREALDGWAHAGHRGVVEAVTGTGKTAVGLHAAATALDSGRKVAVVVPTIELQDQWLGNIQRAIPSARVGRLGDGHADSLDTVDVLLSTVQSACRHQLLPPLTTGLIVADEVHRYGAQKYSDALKPGFDWRLGLTATLERDDNGVAQYLTPYFGGITGTCSYDRGLADGILAHFRVAFVPSPFTYTERDEYEAADDDVKSAFGSLVNKYELDPEPFGEFMAQVTRLADGPFGDPEVRAAKKYLSAFGKRRTLLADASRKIQLLSSIGPHIAHSGSSLVFTETKAAAHSAAAALRAFGVPATDLHSDLTRSERRRRMDLFRSGSVKALAAPRVLDEGIDVPEAELAVILAASRSRRQMIQRMGRVVRPKADGRRAAFVVMYVPGTSEDPRKGAHEGFIDQLLGVADGIQVLQGPSPAPQLAVWLGQR